MVNQATEQIAKQYANAANVRKVWHDLIINVKEYGAVGDGVNDDTEAFQQAINYAISKNKNDIWLPPGTYKYTTLTGTDNITFYGDTVTLNGVTVLKVSSFHALQVRIDNLETNKADKTEINTLATEKANQTDLDTANANIVLKRDKSVKLTNADLDTSADANKIKLINLSNEVQQAMAGTTPINASVANGAVTREKFADASYTRNMTKFYKPATSNLYDKTYNTPGYYNYTDGSFVNSPDHMTTDYIPVAEGEYYIQRQATNINVTFYNESKTFVSGVNAKTWQIPSGLGIVYMRSTIRMDEVDTTIIAKGQVLPVFEEYKVKDEKLLIDSSNIAPSLSFPISNMQGFIRDTTNLFDKSKASVGYYNYSTGAYVNDANYFTSDFISCADGDTFVQKQAGFTTFYDQNKVFISGLQNINPFTVPTGTGIKFVRFTIRAANLDTDMLVKGTVFPAVYTPYNYYNFDKSVINASAPPKSKWAGKLWNVLGDSITFGYLTDKVYHAYVAEQKSISIANYGVSGSRIAQQSGRTDHMSGRYTDMGAADLITVLGGVNDYINGVPLGTMTDTTVDTFYGACHVLFQGLIQKYPAKSIGLITPIQTNRTRAADGLRLTDFVNAYVEVAHYYSLPVLDMYNEGGLTSNIQSVIDNYMPDGLHPDAEGHEIISKRISAFIESI